MGLGTPYSESLSSYLQRLARQHHLRPWQLYIHELVPLIQDKEYLLYKNLRRVSLKQSFLMNKRTVSNLTVLNGIESITPFIVSAIEQLTVRQDLRFLTLISWLEVFDNFEPLLKRFCSWCPHCYQVWQEQEEIIYIPLLWLIKHIQFCPIHHILLKDVCPYCHNKMLNFCQPGYCSHCREWLGQRHPPLNLATYFKSVENLNIYQQNVFYLQELIRLMPSLAKRPQLKDIYLFLHERCAHLNEKELRDFSKSFCAASYLIANPSLCDRLYRSGATPRLLYEIFRGFNIAPRQFFQSFL